MTASLVGGQAVANTSKTLVGFFRIGRVDDLGQLVQPCAEGVIHSAFSVLRLVALVAQFMPASQRRTGCCCCIQRALVDKWPAWSWCK